MQCIDECDDKKLINRYHSIIGLSHIDPALIIRLWGGRETQGKTQSLHTDAFLPLPTRPPPKIPSSSSSSANRGTIYERARGEYFSHRARAKNHSTCSRRSAFLLHHTACCDSCSGDASLINNNNNNPKTANQEDKKTLNN